MFLVGELITDIFTLIHKMLKNTVTRESVNIASECLSLMVVLQTHAKGSDCQISFMTLLLEAIVLLFTNDISVLQLISIAIPYVATTQPINALAFVFDGVNYGVSDFIYSAYSMDLAYYVLKEDESPCIFGSIEMQRWSYACAKQLI